MDIVSTIIPIFTVILLGQLARRTGFIPQSFLEPANRLVFYWAIPAMIFRSVAKASFTDHFHFGVLFITMLSQTAMFFISWAVAKGAKIKEQSSGSFMQCSFHGNLGYIGLAVAYYFLGENGLIQTGILGGFVMILQNLLAVIALNLNSTKKTSEHKRKILYDILANPVIIAAIFGIIFSLTHVAVPIIIGRTLQILSDLALPMALLLIGASLSFDSMKHNILSVLGSSLLKLVLMPILGFMLYRFSGISATSYLPGLILLGSPTATISYVMAKEMNGDPEFAVSAISASTVLSAATMSLWLKIIMIQL